MNKKTKTRLQFLLGGILAVSFAVTGCNNGNNDKEAKKDSIVTTTVPVTPAVKDTMDTIKGNVAPIIETKPPNQ